MSRSLLELVVGCAFFTVVGLAQSSSDPGAAMVSPPAANIRPATIEPGKPSPDEKAEESAIVADPASLIPDLPPVPSENPVIVLHEIRAGWAYGRRQHRGSRVADLGGF